MAMDQSHRDFLRDCNCMVRWDGGAWSPAVRVSDDHFTNPRGLKLSQPDEVRAVTHEQIVAEMDEAGAIPVIYV